MVPQVNLEWVVNGFGIALSQIKSLESITLSWPLFDFYPLPRPDYLRIPIFLEIEKWSLEDFHFTEKNLYFVIFVNRKSLKAISTEKTISKALFEIPVLVIQFLLHNNLNHKLVVDLINKKQQKTHHFLSKISASHGINLLHSL